MRPHHLGSRAFDVKREKEIPMRYIWVLSLALLIGCSRHSTLTEESAGSRGLPPAITLTNLIGHDPYKNEVAHPLICDDEGDFPEGRELIFLKRETREVVHAVFPGKVNYPIDLAGTFELKGHYQGIQKKDRFKQRRKELIDRYRYFVVSTWSKVRLERVDPADRASRGH